MVKKNKNKKSKKKSAKVKSSKGRWAIGGDMELSGAKESRDRIINYCMRNPNRPIFLRVNNSEKDQILDRLNRCLGDSKKKDAVSCPKKERPRKARRESGILTGHSALSASFVSPSFWNEMSMMLGSSLLG
jgi:hypothetical protein